jgi:hypothetical protein
MSMLFATLIDLIFKQQLTTLPAKKEQPPQKAITGSSSKPPPASKQGCLSFKKPQLKGSPS